ncbi:ImuA family protein [Roseixanthobacter pseudopolyaromaticivorans]|uniref:ImuA family protein n=1 Tax=Xanthobacteraceae TaxID=335928 RepID=UPI00372C8F45
MSNPSATRAAGELARLRRCISAIERGANAPLPARVPVPWSAGEAADWDEDDWGQENWGGNDSRDHKGGDYGDLSKAGRKGDQTRVPDQNGAGARNQDEDQDQDEDQAPFDDPGPDLSPPRPLLPLGLLPLGLPPLDAALGGGLTLGALHEAAAHGPGAEAALTAFALALAARAAFQLSRPVLMVQHELAEREAGSLYAPGLAELGLCGGALVLVRVRKPQDVLFVMEEGLKCGGLSAVLGEVGAPFPEALTATRRLSLAARAHPVFGLLLRQRPDPAACAALSRWVIAPAVSAPRDSYGGLGLPTLEAALMRNRLGPLGRWTLSLDGPAFLSAAPTRAVPHHPSHAREAGS